MMEGIEFSLKKITTEQFAIVEEAYSAEKEINLNAGFRFGFDPEQKLIAAFSSFRLEQSRQPFLLVEVGCEFMINDKSWETFVGKETGKLIIDKGFATHLLTITVGTARGVLHAKTEGSRFNQFLLPTINLSETVKADIAFDLSPILS